MKRTDELAVRMGVNIQDLPDLIGIGRASLFSYRTGKRPISAKSWLKLEAAEAAAGIMPAKSEKDEMRRREDAAPCRVAGPLRQPGEPSLTERLATMEANSNAMRASMETMMAALDELTDLFTNRMPKD